MKAQHFLLFHGEDMVQSIWRPYRQLNEVHLDSFPEQSRVAEHLLLRSFSAKSQTFSYSANQVISDLPQCSSEGLTNIRDH